jgi:hypothetical protein
MSSQIERLITWLRSAGSRESAMGGDFPFVGLHFWGIHLAPPDLLPDLRNIREWAVREKLIFDTDQFVADEIVEDLVGKLNAEDHLEILVHLYEDETGAVQYVEYPFCPTAALIKRKLEAKLVYWSLMDIESVEQVGSRQPGIVRYGFWLDGFWVEFASEVTGTLVKGKFAFAFAELRGRHPTRVLKERGKTIGVEIIPEGAVRAQFFKTGRAYDVELTY